MRIGIISDLHLGFRQYGSLEREQDFYNQFLLVCDKINEIGVDMVIIAGDLFDKATPSPAAINSYRKGIEKLNADIVVTIKGNHTMLMRDNHYSIDEYFFDGEKDDYYLLDDGCITTYEFGYKTNNDKYTKGQNVWVDGITYRSNSQIDEFISIQKELSQRTSTNNTYRILVVHQSFKEFCGFFGEDLSINDIDTSSYNAIICGHIHSRKDVQLEDGTWFIQPGSIERMNTTEALDEIQNHKGFYVLNTTSNDLDFYHIPCERKFLLGDIKIESEEDLREHQEELDSSLKKLSLPPIISYDYYNSYENINRVREYIGQVKDSILLNKSNVYDEQQEEISVEITDSELPTVYDAIKSATKDMTDEESKLTLDLYDNLSEGKDVEKILDNFYEKNIKKEAKQEELIDDEIIEIIKYFEELEV